MSWDRWHHDPRDVVIAAILWLVILFWLGPRALDLEHDTHPQHAAQEVTR